ncbi:hypothetical protein NM208_g2326 [Fusarium decemcellulare]|uniref:Uncharacterized protein n=1 Tax=Fusarium decemcellulare TaxID=57161 RepID=A0ACC1STG0_9HYPO|nr:hypothetical protein NM208_g2326 [Fusarium decemcellulare]
MLFTLLQRLFAINGQKTLTGFLAQKIIMLYNIATVIVDWIRIPVFVTMGCSGLFWMKAGLFTLASVVTLLLYNYIKCWSRPEMHLIGLALLSSSTASPVESNLFELRHEIPEASGNLLTIEARAPTGSSLTNYLVYPKAKTPKRDIDAFTKKLQSQAGKDNVQALDDANGQVLVWHVALTAKQVTAIKGSSIIGAVVADAAVKAGPKPSGAKKRALKADKSALPELQMLSTPPKKKPSGYIYDEKAGEGVTIYVLDEGFNLKHNEFTGTPGKKRWIFSAQATGEDDPDGHGSCCASKAVGKSVGVAKKADLVVVKLKMTSWSLLKAWQAVVLDVKENGLQGKAVVSNSKACKYTYISLKPEVALTFALAIGWRVERDEQWFIGVLEMLLKNLEELDVVVVSSAGNFGMMYEVNTYPSKFADRLPIIVTGAVDNKGQLAEFSQTGELVTTTAPGVQVKCVAKSGVSSYQVGPETSGTSFSTPAVAGLAAYFLSLDALKPRLQVRGSVAKNVKALIQEHHYSRVSSGPEVAWNAYTLLKN